MKSSSRLWARAVTSNRWLLGAAVLSHLLPVRAARLNLTALGSLAGIAVVVPLAGPLAFDRRALAAA